MEAGLSICEDADAGAVVFELQAIRLLKDHLGVIGNWVEELWQDVKRVHNLPGNEANALDAKLRHIVALVEEFREDVKQHVAES